MFENIFMHVKDLKLAWLIDNMYDACQENR